jgi:hypothetical protein
MKLDKRLIIGTFVSIVETGTTFGSPSNTVSASLFPDTTTYAASWSSLGDVLDATPETDTEDYGDTVPDAAGGYRKELDTVVLADRLKLSLNSMSEPLHRMMWGAAAVLEDGEAITPFAARERYWEGWIAFTGRNMRDGADKFVGALYVRMRIDGAPKWAKDPLKPAVVCEVLQSTLNSLVPDNIVA